MREEIIKYRIHELSSYEIEVLFALQLAKANMKVIDRNRNFALAARRKFEIIVRGVSVLS